MKGTKVTLDKKDRAIKNNKDKSETKKKPVGVKMKASAAKAEKKTEPKKRLTKKQWTVISIIAASVLLLTAIVLSLVFFVIKPAIEKDKNFDYIKSDLSKYVVLTPEQYKHYSMTLNIAKPREIDVDIALLSMRAMDKDPTPLYDGLLQVGDTVTVGDIVNIYYRGYIVEDGVQRTVVSNLKDANFSSYEIGGCKFPTEAYPVRGVENALVDLNIIPSEHTSFKQIKEGEVKEDHVIYLTFDRIAGEDKTTAESGTKERIDLTSDKVAEAYGVDFKEKIVGKKIGANTVSEFTCTIGGVEYKYTDVVIDFVTECERDPIVVTGYYPYNTGSDVLNNREVTFEIYIQSTQAYSAPELTDEYIEKKVNEVNSGLTMAELLEYEGDSYVQKYRAYAFDYLNEQYTEQLESLIAENMWNYYNEKAQIKRVPGIKVDEIYNEYYSEIAASFEESGGVVYNEMTEETETYTNLSDYAKIYLGLYYSEEDFTVTIRALAEDLVIERMIMYYIMKNEGITPTEADLAAKVAEVKRDYMDEYIYQYLADFESSREEFETSTSEEDREYAKKMDRIIKAWKTGNVTDPEYAEFYTAREGEMFSYYDDAYFTETAYYQIVTEHVISWAEYTTLDTPATK